MVTSGNRQLLIDTGPDRTVLSKLGRAMPFFDRTIDFVIITHPHADHYAGLAAVISRYRVGRILLPAARADTPEFLSLMDTARAADVELVEVGEGDIIRLGEAEFDVLWPARSAEPPPGLDDNAAANSLSLVVRLTAFCDGVGERPASAPECGAALFMGDATQETEAGILSDASPLNASVLKVGHHGSDRSTSAVWLAAVRPEQAVIEVGRNNYGHPAQALQRRLRAAGAGVWRTDLDGDLRIVFERTGLVEVVPFIWRPD